MQYDSQAILRLIRKSSGSTTIKILLGLIVILVVSLFYIRTTITKPTILDREKTTITKTQEIKGQLMPGFPEFPEYPGAVVESSFVGTLGDKTVYGANWQITNVTLDEVTEWYEDNELPTTWLFDQPLTQVGPNKQLLKVRKGNLAVTMIVEQPTSNEPVTVSVVTTLLK